MNPNHINPIYILLHLFGRRYNASQHSVFVKKISNYPACTILFLYTHTNTLVLFFSFVFSRYFWWFNYRIHSFDRGERLPQKNWSSALLSPPKYKLNSKHSSTLKHIIYSKLLFITLELPHIQYGPVHTSA